MMSVHKPEMFVQSGIYKFIWNGDLNIHALVNRIISEGKTLSGELQLFHQSPQGDKLIEQTRINLLSDIKRNQLAKSLTERNNEIDWLNVLKFICVMTVEDYRKGEPVQLLGGKPETMEQEYTLYPILEKSEPTTIFADGGTGKSYFADYVAILVHYNQPGFHIPSIGDLIPSSTNVLYLDWEATLRDHQRRVWAIKQGMGMPETEDLFYYRRCSQPLADDIPEIQKIIVDKNIGFIIIDSQVAASDGEQDKADGARRYYNALRSLNVTSLTLDHVTKGGNGDSPNSKKPYGSTFKWNLSRSQFELKKCQEPGENKLQLALYHRKHNEGNLLKPFGYEIEFINKDNHLDKVIFRHVEVSDIPQLAGDLPVKDQIKAVLKQPKTQDEINELLQDISPDTIKMTLNRHKKLFIKSGNRWGLIEESESVST